MSNLSKLYRAVISAAAPVRSLVHNPEQVPAQAVPLVRSFLPSVRLYIAGLKGEDGGQAQSWSAYLERYLQRADEFFAVEDAQLDPWTAYQHFGYLHNGVVDAQMSQQ